MPEITWTVLPNGVDPVDDSKLKASIFVSLRLDDDTPLGSDFNWASIVASFADAKLGFVEGATTHEVGFAIDKALLSPSLWQGLFPQSARVKARQPMDHSNRTIVSFPAREIRKTAEDVYEAVASRVGFEPPGFSLEFGQQQENGITELTSFVNAVGDEISGFEFTPPPPPVIFAVPGPVPQAMGGPTGSHPHVDDLADKGAFYKAYRFYRRSLNGQPEPPTDGWPQVQVEPPDFHQVVGMLGDHPHLLRRFGLIIDGTIDRNAVPNAATKVKFLASSVNDDFAFAHDDKLPATLYVLDDDSFAAKPAADSDLGEGLLKLGDSDPEDDAAKFEIHQLDVDGTALKLGDYAVIMGRAYGISGHGESPENESLPDPGAELPNLRTAGFVICRNKRSDQLASKLTRSFSFESAAEIDLSADDITRGYRLDVRNTADGVWRSLTQRTGHFLLGGTRVPAVDEVHDEGYVKGTAVTSGPVADGDPLVTPDKPLYLNEVMLGWDGWSQVIKPPGKAMSFDRDKERPEQLTRIENTPETDFQVQPFFKVEPGSLPKLRFGAEYELRARSVDLAGNSLPLGSDTTDDLLKSLPLTFRRYEPVPPPVLVMSRRVVEGESVEHIVIRRESVETEGPNDVFFSTNERHIAPPSTTLELVLMHGMLDGILSDATASFNMAVKSEGTFLDQEIWDVDGKRKQVPGIAVLNTDGSFGAFPSERGVGLKPGQYVIHQNPNLLLPYLPDPLAHGIALVDAREEAQPIEADDVKAIVYSGSWPDLAPLKIQVVASTAAEPSVEISGGNYVVHLPPATILPLRYSSLITEQALTHQMAIWDLLEDTDQANFLDRTLMGQHWMITPKRTLVAVHAVLKPVRPALFTELDVEPARAQGETFVRLEGIADTHSRSSGQVDIEANWVDPVDRLNLPGPTEEAHAGRVFTFRPLYNQDLFEIPGGDEADPPELKDLRRPKQDFGDTKHRFVRYRPDATTRYREYYPAALWANRENLMLLGEEFEVNVLSSDHPAEPEILYVIPTFRWETQTTQTGNGSKSTGTVTSTRVGRGLRVYMARPWFSSGAGELLGVVIRADDAPADAKYISEWGKDPLWRGEGPSTDLAPEDFLNAATVGDDLNIVEDEKLPPEERLKVRAVGFDVEYNAARQLWMADIEMGEVSSYFPFVRLALARYQPDSIPGMELSPIVKAEFAQLVNDRTAVVQVNQQTLRVTVSGLASPNQLGEGLTAPPGPAPAAPPGYEYSFEAGAGRVVTAQLERRGTGNSDGAWVEIGSPVALPSFKPTPAADEPVVLWTGQIPRPNKTPSSFVFRVVIREIEVFQTDQDVAPSPPPLTALVPVRGKVAYLDVIELGDVAK